MFNLGEKETDCGVELGRSYKSSTHFYLDEISSEIHRSIDYSLLLLGYAPKFWDALKVFEKPGLVYNKNIYQREGIFQ